MKKELLKIVTVFFITVGVVLFGLNFIFNQNAPKSKATGETMNLSFSPATQTVAANADFTVSILAKPSINTILRGYKTKVNFDKSKLSFKSIQYKVGVVSAGLGNTTTDVTAVNGNGFIDVIGEDTTATGYVSTAANGAELVNLTFTALSTTGTSVTMSDSSFYSINADATLFDSWTVAAQNLDVNGSGPTLTPIPTGTTGSVKLNLKLKFQGINKLPAAGQNSMSVKIKIYKEGVSTPTDGTGTFVADASGVWSGTVPVNLAAPAGKYRILIKGAQHIQKKICDSGPSETSPGIYRCSDNNITLIAGDNNLDLSGIIMLVGDLDQSGIVDAVDFGLVKNNLGKTDAETLVKADLNRDGVVDTQDYSLILAALSVRTDEL
ncbi:hypothetical protein HZA75_02300 [Candidatus Roizmanbacteria bacterium]|nr:hypothetical protein [Candidatus Roizmanbacteria bacterium]